jgi:hypothetical protein
MEQLLDLFPVDVEEAKRDLLNHKLCRRIIEGCNAISIIIYLFHSLFRFQES